jgi:transcription elongation factor SPT5
MVSAIKFAEKVQTIKNKQWVRLKRGIYKGDLAQVIRTSDQNTMATVKMIPRIDLAAIEEAAKTGQKRKRSNIKPGQALFNKKEIQKAGGEVTIKNGLLHDKFRNWNIFNGNKFKHGFMYKDMKVDGLVTENVIPTVDEIEKFKSRQQHESDAEDESEEDGKKK